MFWYKEKKQALYLQLVVFHYVICVYFSIMSVFFLVRIYIYILSVFLAAIPAICALLLFLFIREIVNIFCFSSSFANYSNFNIYVLKDHFAIWPFHCSFFYNYFELILNILCYIRMREHLAAVKFSITEGNKDKNIEIKKVIQCFVENACEAKNCFYSRYGIQVLKECRIKT